MSSEEVSSGSLAPCSISFTFWCIVHTQIECVPLTPARTQCFGRSSANLENPIFSCGCFSLKSWYSSVKLHNINRFWTCFRPCSNFTETKSFFPRHQPAAAIILIETNDKITGFLWNGTPLSLTSCFAFRAMKFDAPNSAWILLIDQLLGRTVKTCTLTLFYGAEWNFSLSCFRISLSSLGRPGLSPNIAVSIFTVTISSFLFEYFLVLNFRFVTDVSSKSSKHWLTKCKESYLSSSISSESLGESDTVDGLESGSKPKLEPSESFATFFLQVSQILEPIWAN